MTTLRQPQRVTIDAISSVLELDDRWLALDSNSASGCDSSGSGSDADTHTESALHTVALFTDLDDDTLLDAICSEGHAEHENASEASLPRVRQPRGAVVTPAQIEMRRKRNRASMRRTRQRKLLALDHLRQQIEVLERQLSDLRIAACAETIATDAASDAAATDDVPLLLPPPTRPHHRVLTMREIRDTIRTYQLEQMRLQSAIQSRQMLSVSMQQLVDEHQRTNVTGTDERAGELQTRADAVRDSSNNEAAFHSTDSATEEDDEVFLWVSAVLPLLPPITTAHADDDFVRDISLDLVRDMDIADAHQPSVHRVLGWRDVRAVNDCWTDFAFSKDFEHAEIEPLTAKTWATLTCTHERSGLTSEQVHIKVLARISDDVLVMAKSVYYAAAQRYFCSIFVALRVRTADGYVVGRRTIRPLSQYTQLYQNALGDKRTHSDESCGFALTQLAAQVQAASMSAVTTPAPTAVTTTKDESGARRGGGCRVKFAGRIRSETEVMAQNVATRVLLAALHWENTCVEPLRYLAHE